MEIKYGVIGKDRKVLVMAIAEITGADAIYKGVPTCSYEVDYFTVDKEGTIFFDDSADSEETERLLEELEERGFVGQQEGAGHLYLTPCCSLLLWHNPRGILYKKSTIDLTFYKK
jgi:hypothetical protein